MATGGLLLEDLTPEGRTKAGLGDKELGLRIKAVGSMVPMRRRRTPGSSRMTLLSPLTARWSAAASRTCSPSQAQGMWFASYTFMLRGDVARCRSIAGEMIELSRHHAFAQHLAVARICSGWAHVDMGETAFGLKQLEQGLENHRSLSMRGWVPSHLCVCADACLRAGEYARALELLGEALEICGQTKQGLFRPEMLRLQAVTTLMLGRADAPAARARSSKGRLRSRASSRPWRWSSALAARSRASWQGTVSGRRRAS